MVALAQDYKKSNSLGAGYAGALVTVFIWATWIIATRHSSGTHLGTIDLGLIRYGVPALVLAPVWLRTGLYPSRCSARLAGDHGLWCRCAVFQFTTFAIHSTPASAVGVLLGGSMPLAAALIGVLYSANARILPAGWALLRSSPVLPSFSCLRWTVMRSPGSASSSCRSVHLLWAGYTHAFKRSGLTALQGGALIAVWSFLIHVGLALTFGSDDLRGSTA